MPPWRKNTSRVAPIAAAANASVLQNPPRCRQLPVRFRDNGSSPTADEGESFHLKNISDDEEDEAANPAALTVTPVACPSPLQTAMNTTRTDPLATGGWAKPPKSSANVHFFYYRQDPVTQSRICKACEWVLYLQSIVFSNIICKRNLCSWQYSCCCIIPCYYRHYRSSDTCI